jgi:hypothetical protein
MLLEERRRQGEPVFALEALDPAAERLMRIPQLRPEGLRFLEATGSLRGADPAG